MGSDELERGTGGQGWGLTERGEGNLGEVGRRGETGVIERESRKKSRIVGREISWLGNEKELEQVRETKFPSLPERSEGMS